MYFTNPKYDSRDKLVDGIKRGDHVRVLALQGSDPMNGTCAVTIADQQVAVEVRQGYISRVARGSQWD